MEFKDSATILTITFSVVSLFFASVALRRTRLHNRSQIEAQKWIANHTLLAKCTDMVIEEPSLLHLLGIDPESVVADGATVRELVYVIASLDASSVLYRISGESPVTLTQYRKNFLSHPKVRMLWKKYLRGRTFNTDTPWSVSVDNFIRDYEEQQK